MRVPLGTINMAGAVVFDVTFLTALVCHAVEAAWFWGLLGIVAAVSALVVVVLQLLRLVAPGFTEQWWDPW